MPPSDWRKIKRELELTPLKNYYPLTMNPNSAILVKRSLKPR